MKLRKIQIDKRGVLGMDIASAFIIALLILIVVGILTVIVTNALTDSAGRTSADTPITLVNETLTLLDSGTDTSVVQDARTSIVFTNVVVTNSTNSTADILTVANFTVANGIITGTLTSEFNNSLVNFSGTANYQIPSIADNIGNNASTGIQTFFSNATTWFSLLSVVVIILIVGIAIIVIRRFGDDGVGGNTGGSKGDFDV